MSVSFAGAATPALLRSKSLQVSRDQRYLRCLSAISVDLAVKKNLKSQLINASGLENERKRESERH